MLVGLGSVVYALRPLESPEGREWVFALTGPLAIVLGSVGIANMLGLNLLDRITSNMATGLGAVGTVGLVASLLGVWSGVPMGTTSVQTLPTPAAVITPIAAEDEQRALAQIAGTFSYLVRQDAIASGRYPTAITATSDNVLLLASGSIAVPIGTTAEYAVAVDGSSYIFTLTSSSGVTVVLDSTVDYIQSYHR